MSDDWAIRFDHLSKRYSGRSLAAAGLKNLLLHLPRTIENWRRNQPAWVLKDVSLEVRKRECLGVIGRNGADP